MSSPLFPVFELPDIQTPTPAAKQNYRSSVYFDFIIGDFLRDGTGNMVLTDGHEAYLQWCLKVCMTERFTHLAYTTEIGTEMLSALSLENREAIQSAVERTVTEALMVNPRTEYVREFTFIWKDESLFCSFLVKGRNWIEVPLQVTFQ